MLEQAAESPSRHGIPAFQHDLMRLFSIQKSSQHDGPSTSAPLAPHTSEPGESKPGTCHSSAFSISYSHSVRHHWGRLVGRYLSPPDDTLETQRLETGGRRCRRLRGCSSDCSVSELQIGFVEQQLKWRVQGKINGHGIWINI